MPTISTRRRGLESAADGIGRADDASGERLVHDRDRRMHAIVEIGEVPTRDETRADRSKYPGVTW
jgi:hypothetical protein